MARLQILELPEGSSDDRPPFVLVVDQASEDIAKALNLNPSTDEVVSYATAVQRLTGLSIAEQIGARAVLVFEDTIDIPANDTSAYAVGGLLASNLGEPDFTSPLAGKIEVRKPCPYCGDQQMIPTHQFREHVARLHPDESAADA